MSTPKLRLHRMTSNNHAGELAFSIFLNGRDTLRTDFPHRPALIDHPTCMIEMLLSKLVEFENRKTEFKLEAVCSTDYLKVSRTPDGFLSFRIPSALRETSEILDPCVDMDEGVFLIQLMTEIKAVLADEEMAIEPLIRQDFVKKLHDIADHREGVPGPGLAA